MGIVTLTDREWLDVPHESGQRIEIRPLAWAEIAAAERAATKAVLGMFDGLDPKTMELIRAATPGTAQTTAAPDPLSLVMAAVTGWTYGAPVTPENVRALDRRTFAWLHAEIVQRNLLDASEVKA